MNWTLEKLEVEPFVRIEIEGIFDSGEHLVMLEDLLGRPFWKPGTALLLDFRNCELTGTDIETVREASYNRRKNDALIGNGKSAFLMKSLTDFARGRQFQLLTEDEVSAELRIFMEEKEAVNWLTI